MLPLRLRAKFLVLILGSLILFLGVLAVYLVSRESKLLERKAEERQQMLARSIYSALKENMIQGTPRTTLNLIADLRLSEDLARLEVVRSDGTPAFGLQGRRIELPKLALAVETGRYISFDEGKVQHTILYPLKNESICRSCHREHQSILGVLVLTLSRKDSLREIAENRRNLTVFFAMIILSIGSVLYLLVRRVVLQPLSILHQGAERIGRGELGYRISLSTKDEIEDLAVSFNMMATGLQESYSGLEQRIRERTTDVEQKARSLYEHSRDMATISRLSTKVFNMAQPLDATLDKFLWAVTRGLGYKHAMLCLIDRKHARLTIKRDSGLGNFIELTDQPITGGEPFAVLVRTGAEVIINDIESHPVMSRYLQRPYNGPPSIHIAPILARSHNSNCWQLKNCIRTGCPAYKEEDQKCWLLNDTLCASAMVESSGNKMAYCMSCEVFPVLGVLMVGNRSGRPFRRRDASVLRILAADMASALENQLLHEDNRQLVMGLLDLHAVTAAALGEMSVDRALESFTGSALKFLGLDACNFWLLDKNTGELVHHAGGCHAAGEQVCPARLPLDEGSLGKAFLQNQAVAEYDLPLNDPTALGKAAADQEMPAVLAVPLKTQHHTMGVFSVHKKSTTPFLDSEIAAFMLLANHAAMTISVCSLNEELQKQNRELASRGSLMGGILGSMSSGVMLLDPQGVIKLLNQTGADLLHTEPALVVGHRLVDLFPDASVFLSTSPVQQKEAEIRRQDGTSIPIGYSLAVYSGESGAREGTIAVWRDLTEIKTLQAEMMSKERFAAMGQVVAGVAHEIRNPLFAISAIGQIFERELKGRAHLELVGALLSETRRLNHLVEDLLVYGRPAKLVRASCDIMALWKETIEMHREETAQKGIVIEVDGKNVLADLDGHQMRQAFENLMRNAMDATPEGGKIVIRFLLEEDHIILTITDTGRGIPVESRDSIFDLFYTTKPKGSGLGLPICKKIVEDHGGTIAVQSLSSGTGEMAGTTVVITLPYLENRSGVS